MSDTATDNPLSVFLREKCEVEMCGSRVTCSPAPTDTDTDFLVFVKSGKEQDVTDIVNYLHGAGFVWEGASEHYQNVVASSFMSWRKDGLNYIVTASTDFARRHRAATAVCKRLNLLVKADRIAVFRAVLYAELALPVAA